MIDVRRGPDRLQSVQPGISTRHCFAAGQHYDPDNLAFGALIGLDDHELQPGAAFARHAHRRVVILSWVLDGTLRHEGQRGVALNVDPGVALVQIAGNGIEHIEGNPSREERLRFVQTTLHCDGDEPSTDLRTPPVRLAGGTFTVLRGGSVRTSDSGAHLFVARGEFEVSGVALSAGDSARLLDEPGEVLGSGELLVWSKESR